MSLVYNEEQRMLSDTAREFLAARSPVSAQRALRDDKNEQGFDQDLWNQIVEMGWTAIPFPEDLGGLDFGYKGLGAVFEQIGHHLSASPLLSSVVLAGSVLQVAGNPSQQEAWLTAIISGEKRLALAIDEGARHNPDNVTLTAEQNADGYVLNGSKVMVLDGNGVDGWIVAAKADDALNLFLVTPDLTGVEVSRQSLIDSRNTARLTLNNVTVAASSRIGDTSTASQALEKALDHGRLCLAAEILGASEALFAMTVEYLKTRVQFDAPIGSFQALQHRASWMFVELQLARSTLMAALAAVDSKADDAAARISLAKWKVGKMADKVTGEAVQMHGGIGVTDELDVGLYLKRIRVAQASLGDADYHLDRYSKLIA